MVEINNFTDFPVGKDFFIGVAKKVLKGENKEREKLSVAFVSAEKIKKINQKYRKENKPTDVLSFERKSDLKWDYNEIVISPQVVLENTVSRRADFKSELARVLIHGILHCLGYDHEISRKEAEKMFKKEDYYISKI